jgi:hypothetical protein
MLLAIAIFMFGCSQAAVAPEEPEKAEGKLRRARRE